MRIWHKQLIPKLCRQHLLAQWHEGLAIYSILINGKKGYRNHPQVKEFAKCLRRLWMRLADTQEEMIRRGYKPKRLPSLLKRVDYLSKGKYHPWQSLKKQTEILRSKGCECKV